MGETNKEGTHGFGFKKGAKPEEKPSANVVHGLAHSAFGGMP